MAVRPRSSMSTMRPRQRRQGVETALEGAATEFAMLSQRRSRLARQMELLRRQYEAAAATMAQVASRMAALSIRIGALVPEDAVPETPALVTGQPEARPKPPAATVRRRGMPMTY